MTAAVMSSKRIKVGAGTANPYTRHPAVYAMSMATLAELAGERCFLGIGAALRPQEKLLGRVVGDDLKRIREATMVIRRLLAGQTVTFEGETINVKDLSLDFNPEVNVPIYLGGVGPKMVHLAGEIGDGFVASGGSSVAYLKDAVRWMREGATSAGRRPELLKTSSLLFVSLSEDSSEAKNNCKKWLARLLVQPFFPVIGKASHIDPMEIERMKELVRKKGVEEAAGSVPDYLVDEFAAAGTAKEVLQRIDAFRVLEVDELVLAPLGRTKFRRLAEITRLINP
jgi:5,10-methylenetetrahydromethanopterin reductase